MKIKCKECGVKKQAKQKPEAKDICVTTAEKAKYSYLYNWNRVNELGQDYNNKHVSFASQITAPRPDNYRPGNYLSIDFKLKCIICYESTGKRGHYYVVKERQKNWFEISDNEVKLAVECERKNEETIITELNEKYDKKILMAFYDYDPKYKIGV